jgi:hypothetical protein
MSPPGRLFEGLGGGRRERRQDLRKRQDHASQVGVLVGRVVLPHVADVCAEQDGAAEGHEGPYLVLRHLDPSLDHVLGTGCRARPESPPVHSPSKQ